MSTPEDDTDPTGLGEPLPANPAPVVGLTFEQATNLHLKALTSQMDRIEALLRRVLNDTLHWRGTTDQRLDKLERDQRALEVRIDALQGDGR